MDEEYYDEPEDFTDEYDNSLEYDGLDEEEPFTSGEPWVNRAMDVIGYFVMKNCDGKSNSERSRALIKALQRENFLTKIKEDEHMIASAINMIDDLKTLDDVLLDIQVDLGTEYVLLKVDSESKAFMAYEETVEEDESKHATRILYKESLEIFEETTFITDVEFETLRI